VFGLGSGDRGAEARAVRELLRLAKFALLAVEIAECRPGDTVVEVVNQVHNELRSRP